jgi:hypothetical protein
VQMFFAKNVLFAREFVGEEDKCLEMKRDV